MIPSPDNRTFLYGTEYSKEEIAGHDGVTGHRIVAGESEETGEPQDWLIVAADCREYWFKLVQPDVWVLHHCWGAFLMGSKA